MPTARQARILMKKIFFGGVLVSVWFAATVCFAAPPLSVFVSILPQKYFVEKIGRDLVSVSVMVEPGASPATYEPRPRQMVALARARIYFAVGVPFEAVWLDKISATNPGMKVVHTQEGIEKVPMKAHRHHDEADENRHNKRHLAGKRGIDGQHGGIRDPHVWLSPPLVMIQARNILRELLAADPDHRPAYLENYRAFIAEVVALDEELLGIFSGKAKGAEFMVFHPAWGYFAQTYGLEQVSIEVEGKEPKPAELDRMIRSAREKKLKVIFVQPQFSEKTARTIARAVGGDVAFADSLAPGWADNLRKVAAKINDALQ